MRSVCMMQSGGKGVKQRFRPSVSGSKTKQLHQKSGNIIQSCHSSKQTELESMVTCLCVLALLCNSG